MLTSRTQYRYVSGWCSGTMHQRCAGSYAGTACCCSCHSPSGPGPAAEPGRAASG